MEQVTDFRNHHVEVDNPHQPPPAKPAKPAQQPSESKPEIVVTEPGSDAQNARVIKLVEGINRKRVSAGTGWLDEEESEWWERWRRHLAQLDGRIASTALSPKKSKKRRREQTQPPAITNGDVKIEVVDVLGVPPPAEVKDEFAEQVLVVDYEEEEKDDGGVNEDLRVGIKVAILHVFVCHRTKC